MYKHKQGKSFDWSGPVALSRDGVPLTDLTGFVGTCQVRRPMTMGGALIADINFEWLDASLSLVRLHLQDTTNWAVGPAEIDIRLVDSSGNKVPSATTTFEIVNWVTHE